MVELVLIFSNELILGMSLIKMLKKIGPSIDPWVRQGFLPRQGYDTVRQGSLPRQGHDTVRQGFLPRQLHDTVRQGSLPKKGDDTVR